MAGIFFLHTIEHYCAFEGSLIAEMNIFILGSEFGKFFAHRSPFRFGQFWQLIDNISGTHRRNLTAQRSIVRTKMAKPHVPAMAVLIENRAVFLLTPTRYALSLDAV
jgi:hypothetical protein